MSGPSDSETARPLVVAITGASGARYATRLLEVLADSGRLVHCVVSPAGAEVLNEELPALGGRSKAASPGGAGAGTCFQAERPEPALLGERIGAAAAAGRLRFHHHRDLQAPIASGSYRTAGMVVCPCSGSTLASIAHGVGSNLIHRAADVHLKERRRLVLVPRETPLSLIHLENQRQACLAGAVILPAAPGWYHRPTSLEDLVDFVVARILDQLELPQALIRPWGSV